MTPNTTRRSLAKLLIDLDSGVCSTNQLADRNNLSYEAVREFINDLREVKFVHVADWRTDSMGRRSIKLWKLGYGEDAPKPPPVPGTVRSARYKARTEDGPRALRHANRAAKSPVMKPRENSLEAAFGIGTSSNLEPRSKIDGSDQGE